VGGAIRRPDEARAARAAGADFVVVGTALEAGGEPALAALVHAVAG
jgi:heptaprenylglyceryl phosphate synthase